MRPAFFSLAAVALFAMASAAPAQTPMPSATPEAAAAPSPTPAKRHRTKKVTPAPAASPASTAPAVTPAPAMTPAAATPEASPSPAKMTRAEKKAAKAAGGTPAAQEVLNATPAPGGGNGMVWVNTKSHVYHKEGSRFYGKTKAGKYLSEKDAMAEGDHAAGHGE